MSEEEKQQFMGLEGEDALKKFTIIQTERMKAEGRRIKLYEPNSGKVEGNNVNFYYQDHDLAALTYKSRAALMKA